MPLSVWEDVDSTFGELADKEFWDDVDDTFAALDAAGIEGSVHNESFWFFETKDQPVSKIVLRPNPEVDYSETVWNVLQSIVSSPVFVSAKLIRGEHDWLVVLFLGWYDVDDKALGSILACSSWAPCRPTRSGAQEAPHRVWRANLGANAEAWPLA